MRRWWNDHSRFIAVANGISISVKLVSLLDERLVLRRYPSSRPALEQERVCVFFVGVLVFAK
jgi:hypothetical protein